MLKYVQIVCAYSQYVESLWGGLKLRIVKKLHEISPSLLPSYLA